MTGPNLGGLAIGKPVVVVSKLENSVAFIHLQHLKFYLQSPKSKFGIYLVGTQIGIWNLDQYFQSMDFFLSLMAYMLRCIMLLVLPSTRTTSFTSRRCRNTSVGDLARSSPLNVPLTLINTKIRRPQQTFESPLIILLLYAFCWNILVLFNFYDVGWIQINSQCYKSQVDTNYLIVLCCSLYLGGHSNIFLLRFDQTLFYPGPNF